MHFKVRVLGTHRPLRGSPVAAWAYHAEIVDQDNGFQQPEWSCEHSHETPQLARSCGEQWLTLRNSQEQAAAS